MSNSSSSSAELGPGKKFDSDKLRWDLLPLEVIEGPVQVLTFGAKKYGSNNWQNVHPFNSRYFAALMRHLKAWQSGEFTDPESGRPHLDHAMCNLIFLRWGEMHPDSVNQMESPPMPASPKSANLPPMAMPQMGPPEVSTH